MDACGQSNRVVEASRGDSRKLAEGRNKLTHARVDAPKDRFEGAVYTSVFRGKSSR